MKPVKRKNPKTEGIFGTQGLINPRAHRRQIGSAPSVERVLRNLGQALNERADAKAAEETSEAAEDVRETGGLYADAFDDGSGGGKKCIINEDGEIDCTGQPTGQGGNSGVKDGLARGAESDSIGDLLIAMANKSGNRKRRRQKTNRDISKYFLDRSTLGNHDAQLNLPLMQLAARYFDRRAEKIKSRRDSGNYGGSYSF